MENRLRRLNQSIMWSKPKIWMDWLTNSTMPKKASMHRLWENPSESRTSVAIKNGQERLMATNSELQLPSASQLKKFSIPWVAVLKRNKKLPWCTRKLMETLVQESKRREIMIGPITGKLQMVVEIFWLILSVMVSRGFLQERLSQSNQRELMKASQKRSLLRR